MSRFERMETEGDKVEVLKSIFPNLDEDIVIDALASNEWNVEAGVQSLLIISENQICSAKRTDVHYELKPAHTPGLPQVTPLQEVSPIGAKPRPKSPLPQRERGKARRHFEISAVTQGPAYKYGERFIREHPKALILMRGVPGSGKSTLAKELAKAFNGVSYSTDDFHYDENGVYNFDPARLPEAHTQNQRRACFAMEAGISPVVVDNTNLELWETRPYAISACKHGYEIAVLEPDTPWRYDPRICGQKNTHGVSKNKISQMIEKLRRNTITANQVKAYGLSCLANHSSGLKESKPIEKGKHQRKRYEKGDEKELKDHTEPLRHHFEAEEFGKPREGPLPTTSFEPMLPPSSEKIPAQTDDETKKTVATSVSELVDFNVVLEHGERGRSDTSTSGQTSDHDGASSSAEEKPKKARRRVKIAARFSNPTTELDGSAAPTSEPSAEETEMSAALQPTKQVGGSASRTTSEEGGVTSERSVASEISKAANTEIKEPSVSAEITPSISEAPIVLPSEIEIKDMVLQTLRQDVVSPSILEVNPENVPLNWDGLCFKPESSIVPQEIAYIKPNVVFVDVGVQTNFGDNIFIRVLETCPRPISAGLTSPPPIRMKLTLDKGTCIEEGDFESCASVRMLVKLFPSAGVESLKDVLENCRGDVDWAVNVLLDSGYDMAAGVEEEMAVEDEFLVVEEVDGKLDEVKATEVGKIEVLPEVAQEFEAPSTPSHGAKQMTREESEQLKSMVEEMFVMSPSVSEHARRITGKVDYSSFKAYEIRLRKGLEVPRLPETPPDSHPASDAQSIVSGSTEGEGGESLTEDEEMIPMTLPKEFAVRLGNMFSSSADGSLKGISELKPEHLNLVIPKSLAFELFSYWCSSLFCLEETQQGNGKVAVIENKTANARRETNLQEIMDMELALQITEDEKNNSEEMRNIRKTMSFKLTQNKLHESFPQVDPAYLDAVFEAHSYNYENTVEILKELTGESERPTETRERMEVVHQYHEVDEALATPVSDWQDARSSAQKHIARKQSYLTLADAAHRKGMPAVASYYTRQARFHAESAKDYDGIAAELLAQKSRVQNEDGYTVDLHFLYVPEALKVLDGHIKQLRERGEIRAKGGYLQVITGRGLRSINGVSRIKPAVEAYLKQKKIKFEELNPGMLKVYLR